MWLSFRIIIVLGLSSFFAVGVDDCLGLFGVAPCRKTSLQMALLRADPWGSVSSEGLAESLHAAFRGTREL